MYAVFIIIAGLNLGSNNTPETYFDTRNTPGECAIELDYESIVTKVNVYNGHESGSVTIKFKDSDNKLTFETSKELTEGFKWTQVDTGFNTAKYVEISVREPGLDLFEVVLYGTDIASPLKISAPGYEAIADEQDSAVYSPTYKDGMYFDEIYFARTAYEFIKGEEPFEWTHPPLGKLLIAIGILVAGMNPFGWRIVGVLLGGLCIPAMYIFGKALFGKKKLAFLAAGLIMFDFMLLVQSRISTSDSFLLLFVILMFYFMYRYLTSDETRSRITTLCLSGLFFGLAASVKWSALYGGIGLAIIYLIKYIKDMSMKKSHNERVSLLGDNLLYGAAFFILLPAVIYFSTYIPGIISGKYDGLMDVFKLQKFMLDYHSKLTATHSFSSKWWEWPLMIKPVWLSVSGGMTEGATSTIASFGNPAIWWASIPAVLLSLYIAFTKKEIRMLAIVAAFLSMYMPWVFVPRLAFIYHFLPAIPFAIFAIVYLIEIYTKHKGKTAENIIIILILGAVAILFAVYYPVLTGFEVDRNFVNNIKLLDTWVF